MKVKKLIKKLKKMPKDAAIFHLWDGEPRTKIEMIWLSKGGDVITSDYGAVCYSTKARPIDAPTKKEKEYWKAGD